MTEQIARSFVQEIVLGFGFLNGLWIAVGVNPETEILRAFSDIIKSLDIGGGFTLLFWLIPIILTLGSLFASYFIGGWLGLGAVGMAFLGGALIIRIPTFAVILLIVAVMMGFAAPFTSE